MSSSCQKTLVGLALASVLATGCEPPPVVPTADRRQNQQLSRIEGQVVVQSRARGNAIVLLYDADRPPPPQGAGRPLSFTVIPAAQLFGPADPSSYGPFTASFTFSLVNPGRYLLRGFIDADTCLTSAQPCHTPDFLPWYGITGEPGAGDVGGAAVDPVTRVPRVVEVAEGPDGALQAATGVTVSFSDSTTVPMDRPAFQVVGDARFNPAAGAKRLELKPLQVHEGAVDVRPPGLVVRYVDNNSDGTPVDADRDGEPDLWPRVLVRKLAEGQALTPTQRLLTDENDLNRDGVLDTEGTDYIRADGKSDGLPDQVVLVAKIVQEPALMDALRSNNGTAVVSSLGVQVLPQALDARDPRNPVALRSVPSGRYAVTLVHFTGQTWRVPNELAPTLASEHGLPSVESQSFVLEVP
ncbi:hypothetical protein [Vitiosangium sp. GDMCC 1.1324]|uniref:hypothetical protein n=1 Tax=Vitiosangium sp. (strain GDMCC 1.1324) TaxID=2138576 RepID=UPI000D3B1F7E|nr:hypothetical protein [Vitiosangium sp. GDMCC 1.1324]PTL83997.1 hypothetical protein DAT35_11095 [Vitiosangium sp. GDMCC 1.1324]